ncbi:hypothetical protein Y032_0648g1104 [Ancylostoma ceylanicum]|uniref:Uncharacterized protein n=1 Tax=Ancylostoma ceylanicum TaxID=53326 RepID=A0A016WK36_9BILA|nr:hypothetical protein Y032_0648g1104 [Ancylostoma ceylanicum]
MIFVQHIRFVKGYDDRKKIFRCFFITIQYPFVRHNFRCNRECPPKMVGFKSKSHSHICASITVSAIMHIGRVTNSKLEGVGVVTSL